MTLHNPELLPLIPERLLHRAHIYERYDTRFRAAARLLQALWRERRKLPEGHYTNAAGARRRLGSRLASDPRILPRREVKGIRKAALEQEVTGPQILPTH